MKYSMKNENHHLIIISDQTKRFEEIRESLKIRDEWIEYYKNNFEPKIIDYIDILKQK